MLTLIPFRASLVTLTVKRVSAMRETGFDPWVGNIPWRRKWRPTPVHLLGKSHGQRSLVGYSPWSCRVGRDWAIGSNTLHPCWQSLIPFWKILERRWVMKIRRSKMDWCLENSWEKEPTTQTKRNVNLSCVKCFSCHFHSSCSREVQWSLFYRWKKWDQRGWLA